VAGWAGVAVAFLGSDHLATQRTVADTAMTDPTVLGSRKHSGIPWHCPLSYWRNGGTVPSFLVAELSAAERYTTAAGGKIYKLKYGHRSHNQPVLDLTTQRAYLTSQNHGYAVDVASLEAAWEPWFISLNDGSNEGIRHKTGPFRSVQFHPEAAAGLRDTRFLFDDFLRAAGEFHSTNGSHRERV
jgi:Glutamine amidotransferase class-I